MIARRLHLQRQHTTNIRMLGSVNTHMHADHITGTGYLKQLLPNVHSVISLASGAEADEHLNDGDVISFGRHEIKAVSTPGHTNGCMTFINYEQVRISIVPYRRIPRDFFHCSRYLRVRRFDFPYLRHSHRSAPYSSNAI